MKNLTFSLKLILSSLFITGFFFAVAPQKINALEVEVESVRNIYIENSESVKVVETHTIKNNSTQSYLRQENIELFIISHLGSKGDLLQKSVATAKVTSEGKDLAMNVTYEADQALLKVSYPRKVGIKDKLVIVLEYTNFGLLEKTGALIDVFAPGLVKDVKFETANQSFDYKTNLFLNKEVFKNLNFVLPNPSKIEKSDPIYDQFSFTREDMLGKTVWMQIGTVQYYQFSIVQKVTQTMQNNLGFQNEYRLVIPRDVDNAEIYQKVYFDKIFPIPSYVEKDVDGNLIAVFNVLSSDQTEINISGYVEVGLTNEKVSLENSGDMDAFVNAEIANFLKPAEFWEVDAEKIVSTAKQLKGVETNVYKILGSTFNFITEKIDYNEVKRFGKNERQGALATLEKGSGVCMEYSDLFLSIARAQGIPSKAVFGYGYDPQESSNKQESHQWVVSLVPGLNKWLDIDVTWGDSGKAAEGAYLNHFYTHIVSSSPVALPEVSLKSFGSNAELELPQYKIQALSELPEDAQLYTQQEMLTLYPFTNNKNFTTTILEIPLKIGAFFANVSNKDLVSIIFFTVGFTLLLLPLIYVFRNKIDFGKNNKNLAVIANEKVANQTTQSPLPRA